MRKKPIALVALVALLLAGLVVVPGKLEEYTVSLPEYRRPAESIWLEQGWSDAQRTRFHHTPQGTRLIPYAWFMALEQPCFSLFSCPRLADPGYLGRFGFIPSKTDPELNPGGLPVGFALQRDFIDPVTKQAYPVVGLTCAACHTAELHYGKYAVQIDGGPALIEVAAFQKAIGLSLGFTTLFPGRYGRFEARVLGPQATADQKAALRKAFESLVATAKAELAVTKALKIYANPAGFGRTDALTRIGNQIFAVDMRNDGNYAAANAAVRFPQIWDAAWFNWVQYNSSIADPLVRNIGESLGLRAPLKLHGPDAKQFESSVNVAGLHTLEELLAGPAPFKGLSSPKWPGVFPHLDPTKVSRGADLYRERCNACHLPDQAALLADLQGEKPKHWWRNTLGHWFLKVTDVPLERIGTDPRQALDFKARTADSGPLGLGRISASQGLELVTRGISLRFFESMQFTPEQRIEWGGFRDPEAPAVRDDLVYKARPLNGIWAVAPYLHNGSIPNLYLLLSPQAERPETFWLGSRQYDPVNVGYETSVAIKGATLYDTRREGNSNRGHEFNDGPKVKGVIGPLLSVEDRWALIEFMKSL